MRIRNLFSRRGLVLISPKQRYGYLDEDCKEKLYLDKKCSTRKSCRRYYLVLFDVSRSHQLTKFRCVRCEQHANTRSRRLRGNSVLSKYYPGKLPYRDLATQAEDLLNP